MKRAFGFTLLELMIVIVVIAVLAAVAISSYQKQLRKSRRAEAKQWVTTLALAEEKYRADHATYPVTAASVLNGTPSLSYYTVAIASPATTPCPDGSTATTNGNSFRITATATSASGQSSDTGCTALVLNSKCGQVSKTPTTCW